MGGNRSGSAVREQRRMVSSPHRKQAQQQQQQQALLKKPAAASPGANWKNAAHKHQHHKPGNKRKVPKKASSDPRDSKRVCVVAASPNKRVHLSTVHERRQATHSFPRGKRGGNAVEPVRAAASTSHAGSNSTRTASSSSLDDEIIALARFVSLSPQERAFRARKFREIQELICSAFPDATVELYGSSSNGLETFRSDVDISVGNISLSDSLRADVDSALAGQEDGARGEDDEEDVLADDLASDDDEDYDDERYCEPVRSAPEHEPPLPTSNNDTEGVHTDSSGDDEPSFSLNIATPRSKRTSIGFGLHESPLQRQAPVPPLSSFSAAAKSPWNPTLRRKKLRVLRALQYLLKLKRPALQVKCLPKAKVPILMVRDAATELSMDIGVNREAFAASDHGRTTALVVELQRVLGDAFRVLVTVLKEFLHQFDLDKPFTGGLGSFRLYIMVASLFPLEQCHATGRVRVPAAAPVPSVSALLLAFFEAFGNKRHPAHLTSATVLALPFRDSSVDFASVFRLSDCVDAFAMAHDILRQTRSLGSIVFEDRLADERARVRKAALSDRSPSTPQRPRR